MTRYLLSTLVLTLCVIGATEARNITFPPSLVAMDPNDWGVISLSHTPLRPASLLLDRGFRASFGGLTRNRYRGYFAHPLFFSLAISGENIAAGMMLVGAKLGDIPLIDPEGWVQGHFIHRSNAASLGVGFLLGNTILGLAITGLLEQNRFSKAYGGYGTIEIIQHPHDRLWLSLKARGGAMFYPSTIAQLPLAADIGFGFKLSPSSALGAGLINRFGTETFLLTYTAAFGQGTSISFRMGAYLPLEDSPISHRELLAGFGIDHSHLSFDFKAHLENQSRLGDIMMASITLRP